MGSGRCSWSRYATVASCVARGGACSGACCSACSDAGAMRRAAIRGAAVRGTIRRGRYAEWRYAGWRYAEWRYAGRGYAGRRYPVAETRGRKPGGCARDARDGCTEAQRHGHVTAACAQPCADWRVGRAAKTAACQHLHRIGIGIRAALGDGVVTGLEVAQASERFTKLLPSRRCPSLYKLGPAACHRSGRCQPRFSERFRERCTGSAPPPQTANAVPPPRSASSNPVPPLPARGLACLAPAGAAAHRA